jgi:hypothetical protein
MDIGLIQGTRLSLLYTGGGWCMLPIEPCPSKAPARTGTKLWRVFMTRVCSGLYVRMCVLFPY